jgi:SulP family sulfate permease
MHVQTADFLPFIPWLRRYGRAQARADLTAGLTVAVVAVPQSMAYALIAGLPVQYGLYASIVPTVVASLWGSSAHLITGPTTAVSLVVMGALSPLAAAGSPAYIQLAFVLALLVGGVQIMMGLARLGGLLNFVSHAVILGFTAGAAVLIAGKQLPALLGLGLPSNGNFGIFLLRALGGLPRTHLPTLVLGGLTIAMVLALRHWRPGWPGPLLAMLAVGGAVAVFDLDRHGVAVVGVIPGELPPFHPPDLASLEVAGDLAPAAVAIALLGLVEAVSIAKSIADQTRQRLNVNQEFIAQGLANGAAAMFSGYPGSGSFTRSAVNFRSGARTPMSGIVSAAAVALTALLAAPLAAKLPLAALAGVLMVVAVDMVRVEDMRRTVLATRSDATVLVVTFLATVLLHLEFAIYIGVMLSIGLHLAKTSRPRIYSAVPDPETGKLVGSAFGETCPQMDIVHIEGSVFFGSVAFVLEDLQQRLRQNGKGFSLLLRLHQVNLLDASGVHVLETLLEEVRHQGGGLYLCGANPRVFDVIKNSGLLREIGSGHIRPTTEKAIRQAMRESFCPAVCAVCEIMIFRECVKLKQGDWQIFGPDVEPRQCSWLAAPQARGARARRGAK